MENHYKNFTTKINNIFYFVHAFSSTATASGTRKRITIQKNFHNIKYQPKYTDSSILLIIAITFTYCLSPFQAYFFTR